MLKTCVRMAGVVCLVTMAAPPARAQATRPTGKLLVTVVDQTGGVLPTAPVTIAGQDEATRTTALTALASAEGIATFDEVPLGRYTLQAEFPGFGPVVLPLLGPYVHP